MIGSGGMLDRVMRPMEALDRRIRIHRQGILTALTVSNNCRVLSSDCFVGDSCSQVNGQQDRILLSPRGVEGSLKEHCTGDGN